MSETERETMTLAEAAQALGVTERTAQSYAARKMFPCMKIGRRVVIRRDLFFRWLNKESQVAEGADAA